LDFPPAGFVRYIPQLLDHRSRFGQSTLQCQVAELVPGSDREYSEFLLLELFLLPVQCHYRRDQRLALLVELQHQWFLHHLQKLQLESYCYHQLRPRLRRLQELHLPRIPMPWDLRSNPFRSTE
uniref:MOV10L1 n=1 Tax=Haemonchus placei TaxID=6290 RepID=A0A158QPT2_HAEPC